MSKFTDFLKSALGKKKEEATPVASTAKASKSTTTKTKKASTKAPSTAAKPVRKASGRGK